MEAQQVRGGTRGHWLLKRLRNVFFVISEFYGVVTALLLIGALLGVQFRPIDLFMSTLPGSLLPAPFLLVGLTLLRRRTGVLLLVPVAALVALYGWAFLPRAGADPGSDPQIRVLTFNTHAEAENVAPMVTVVRYSGADVVLLQELSDAAAAAFHESLSDLYPYQSTHTSGVSVVGKGILSRYPLEDEELGFDPESPRYQRVTITIGGQTLAVYNVHMPTPNWGLGYDTSARDQTIASLIDRTQQETDPVLIGGDFNTNDMSAGYRLMAAAYSDTFREAGGGLGLTWPDFGGELFPLSALWPLVRLDYVWHGNGLRGVEAHAGESSGGSDHQPLFARLVLTQVG